MLHWETSGLSTVTAANYGSLIGKIETLRQISKGERID